MNMKMDTTWSVAARILKQARKNPDRPALTVDGETWSYSELLVAAHDIANKLPSSKSSEAQMVTAIRAQRHFASYAGILAAMMRGHTYAPVNLDLMNENSRAILDRSSASHIICGESLASEMEDELRGIEADGGRLRIIGCGERKQDYKPTSLDSLGRIPEEIPANDIAYLLFTSGSTGQPKGVPITYANLTGYLDAVDTMLQVSPDDVFSQTFALTFDLSVHDLFVCWTHGAHLVVPTRGQLAKPAAYIRDHHITCWFSVPSLAYQLRQQGELCENAFPGLRSSLFCGEALPAVLANEWSLAAPNSTVENWYGPTEATIACARYVLPPAVERKYEGEDVVPIGEAFPGMNLTVHGKDLSFLSNGSPGELLLSGRQVARGYLGDPEKTTKSFVKLPGKDEIFYRTGDLVRCDEDGIVHFLGRIDNQVKIRGYRVELGAIEAALRKATGGHNAIAMSYPPNVVPGRSIVAAIETNEIDASMVLAKAREFLPEYMIPSDIVCLSSFPKNASGKADRGAIALQTAEAILTRENDSDIPALDKVEAQLMDAILTVSPILSRRSVLKAETLIAAGMDSLSFVSLTAEIERVFGKSLNESDVVLFAELSFKEMVESLRADVLPPPANDSRIMGSIRRMMGNMIKTRLKQKGKPAPQILSGRMKLRANRAVQFIERFPSFLETIESPTVIAVGSSGIFRAISPSSFGAAAKELGHEVQCVNIGLPAVNCAGLSMICSFIRDRCTQKGVRFPLAIYELDPMHLSVLPPKGDIDLNPNFFNGKTPACNTGKVDKEFEWNAATLGACDVSMKSAQVKLRPSWETKRGREIARTYSGDVAFVETALEAWLEGARCLLEIADRVACFVHPVNPSAIPMDERFDGDCLNELLRKISKSSEIEIIPWESFELSDEDFLNINHVNPWSGVPKLNPQLAKFIYE